MRTDLIRVILQVLVIITLVAIGAYGGYMSAPPHILELPCEINIQDLRLAQTAD
jgi:hypothetical protein